MKLPLSINLVDKFLISSLHSLILKHKIEISPAAIPEDFFIDDREQYLPDTVFKYLIYTLYMELSPQHFLEAIEAVIRDEIIPKANENLGAFKTLEGALIEHTKAAKLLSSEASLGLEQLPNETWLTRPANPNKIWSESAEIFSIVYRKILIESFLKEPWRIDKIALSGSEKPKVMDTTMFKHCALFLGREASGLTIKNTLLSRNVVSCSGGHIESQSSREDIFLIRFRRALSPYVNFGRVPIEFASKLLNTEVRTLQRCLSAESTTYRAELDKLIFEKVKRLLKERCFSVTDIAYHFNYTDSSNFARAFKRYAGMSPQAYRAMSQND